MLILMNVEVTLYLEKKKKMLLMLKDDVEECRSRLSGTAAASLAALRKTRQ